MQEVPTHVAPQVFCFVLVQTRPPDAGSVHTCGAARLCVCVCVYRPDHLMQEVPTHVAARVVCVRVVAVGGCMCVCFVCIAYIC